MTGAHGPDFFIFNKDTHYCTGRIKKAYKNFYICLILLYNNLISGYIFGEF